MKRRSLLVGALFLPVTAIPNIIPQYCYMSGAHIDETFNVQSQIIFLPWSEFINCTFNIHHNQMITDLRKSHHVTLIGNRFQRV